MILALAPLLGAGLVDGEDIVVVAVSGTTGAGRAPSEALHASRVLGDLSADKVGGRHQHAPEIAQPLGVATRSFAPVLAPVPRGILATCTARLRQVIGTAALRGALDAVYAGEPFVRLLPDGSRPHTAATVGSNNRRLQAAADTDTGRAVIVAALDHLGKGAARADGAGSQPGSRPAGGDRPAGQRHRAVTGPAGVCAAAGFRAAGVAAGSRAPAATSPWWSTTARRPPRPAGSPGTASPRPRSSGPGGWWAAGRCALSC